MTIEEQKKMVENNKANAKSDMIYSILFVAVFLTIPISVIGYHTYDYIKTKQEAKIRQKEKLEKANTLKTSMCFMNNVKGK